MDKSTFVKERVHVYYWDYDLNCATTTLKTLSEFFDVELNSQVIDAAIGMHGAGGYQAQCGLVEGALMFVGILGRAKGIPDKEIISFCKKLAGEFEKNFGSLLCKILRPEGFHPDNPPHLCEKLTSKAISKNIDLISSWLKQGESF
ncbi:C_GCAxxG_C_C family protein [Desulfohalobiaceae bacterium Ax17]|uniref:C-GCAxxG-C-C family protein n=1 Tax=Desulfovulcanus ferrireducens TaxID=2831190 RepID=UPI00207BC533|nr:C-GCAxxG-C-C family protein [Desulfovulcanus ferrireducens]MBT8763176.1 C_GCAxxG_C_C family protein [Desulfovulcanus ferrireducens]